MENMLFCQSCGMPLEKEEDFGMEKNGSHNSEYCRYCYVDGAFTTDETMEQMIESCIPHCINNNPWPNAEVARAEMMKFFPSLKRWKKA